eukprot:COSAG02_NODE_76945_length_130_cov_27.161290_1_plen_26_part_10
MHLTYAPLRAVSTHPPTVIFRVTVAN